MRNLTLTVLAGAFGLLATSPAAAQTRYASAEGEMDIVQTAISAESFQTLVAAVKAAGLVETLKGDGPFTVFAPTDEAFAKLPAGTLEDLLEPENRDKLQAILTYHVVPGKLTASQVVSRRALETAQGGELSVRVKDGTAMVDEAKILKTDIMTSNGVIHAIDSVMLPK